MRFRLVCRQKGTLRRAGPSEPPSARPEPPRAAELDNPYGRYYGKARSFEELKKPK